MVSLKKLYLLLGIMAYAGFHAQPYPAAKFSFNNGVAEDEISHKKPAMVNTNFMDDRFGNERSAVLLYGNLDSYVNLGSYDALKPREGSISVWVYIETIIYAGEGIKVDPIIVAKNCSCPDFNEGYSIYYALYRDIFESNISRDSTRQVNLQTSQNNGTNKWHHLVLTYSDSSSALYLNGQLQSHFKKSFISRFSANDSVLVGVVNNENNKRCLRGGVDDLAFYDTVLSPREVEQLYHAPNPNKNAIWFYRMMWLAGILLAITIIYLIFKYRFKLKLKKEKRILENNNKQLENELRINRALMNPHFVFNAMNTLQNLILNNNTEKASDYLVKFSKLIRKILDSNMSDNISLEQDIELIEMYLEIESLRFREQFTHHIRIAPDIIPSTIIIPIMMLQPFIENSVWHGLRDKPGEKRIDITISFFEENYLECIIEDNGTGRKKKEANSSGKKSQATNFVLQRLALLNKIHDLKCSLTIIDKEEGQGTIVKLILPLLNKFK